IVMGDERRATSDRHRPLSRRDVLSVLGGALATPALARLPAPIARRTGRLRQSVSRWCYGRIPLDDLCEAAKTIGYKSVELLDEKDWAVVAKHGLTCAMANGFGTIPVGFNDPANHDKLVADGTAMIPKAAA